MGRAFPTVDSSCAPNADRRRSRFQTTDSTGQISPPYIDSGNVVARRVGRPILVKTALEENRHREGAGPE